MFRNVANTLASPVKIAGALAMLTLTGLGMQELSSAHADVSKEARSCEPARWLGMENHALQNNLGSPSQSVALPDGVGAMVFYTQAGACHYVFELGRENKVSVVHARRSDGAASPQFITVSSADF
jgi:hypothetical protein